MRVAKDKNFRPDTDVPKITMERKIKAVECENIALQIDARACLPQGADPGQKSTTLTSDMRANSQNVSGISNVSVRKDGDTSGLQMET